MWAGGDIDQCVIVSESGMCGLVVTDQCITVLEILF